MTGYKEERSGGTDSKEASYKAPQTSRKTRLQTFLVTLPPACCHSPHRGGRQLSVV